MVNARLTWGRSTFFLENDDMPAPNILVAAELMGDAYVAAFAGRIDEQTARQIPGAAQDAFLAKAKVLVFDLTGVEFISSAGLGVLVTAIKTFPGRVCFAGPKQYVRDTLRMNRMDILAKVHPTVAAAVAG